MVSYCSGTYVYYSPGAPAKISSPFRECSDLFRRAAGPAKLSLLRSTRNWAAPKVGQTVTNSSSRLTEALSARHSIVVDKRVKRRSTGSCPTGAMARIRSISEGNQDVKTHPTEVDLYYQTFIDTDGQRYIHLTTFGADSRASHPKSSQSIQLDESQAIELLRVMAQTFGIETLR
jgi:hypothetical protein